MSEKLIKSHTLKLRPDEKLVAALRWDNAKTVECDLMAFMMDKDGMIPTRWDIIFYNVPKHVSKSIRHLGTALSENAAVDKIEIALDAVPEEFERLMFLSCVYDAKEKAQCLASAGNLCFELNNAENGEQLYSGMIDSDSEESRSIIIAQLVRGDGCWTFETIAQEDAEQLVGVIATRYGMRVDWRSDYKSFDPKAGIFA